MSTAPSDRAFEAPDLIEVMEEAVRYNRFLVGALVRWAEGAQELLDYGAGNGRFCVALAERGHATSAVEPDPGLRARIETRGVPAWESLVAIGSERRFDGVYGVNVLEHVEGDVALLRDWYDLLWPGGRLLVYVPAFDLLFSSNDRRVGHLRRYRLLDLKRRVESAGFQVERVRYVDSLGFAAALTYRLFGSREGDLAPGAVRRYDRWAFPISRVLDRLLQRWVGKNLLLTARRPV